MFFDEIDSANSREEKLKKGLIVKLRDVWKNFGIVERVLVDQGYTDYENPLREKLRKIKSVLDNYRLSLIELKGIEVAEVCQIFQRINLAGRPLSIFGIVVAKTFRAASAQAPGFYLRDLVEDFRDDTGGNYAKGLDDEQFLEMVAVLVQQHIADSEVSNITARYLSNLRTEHILTVWDRAKDAIRKSFDFLDNHLHLDGPQLIPFRYFYLTLVAYFYENRRPDYEFLQRYFWYYSFHNEDLLTNTTQLKEHVTFLANARAGEPTPLKRFLIDKNKLRTASYSSRGRLSRAILALFANREPRDWANPDRGVRVEVYYVLTDKPNLHHVFPSDFVEKNPGASKLDANSLMNIAYLTQLTNIQISNKNPVVYLRKFDGPRFDEIKKQHLLPNELMEWARTDTLPKDGLVRFIEGRTQLVLDALKEKLGGVPFEVIDTR